MAYRPRSGLLDFPNICPKCAWSSSACSRPDLRTTFESYGFAPIETPSVEELEVLLAKGETDKEIYTIERLQADEAAGGDARLGLHYDLTVPFARYVAQHFNELVFPFKRYQMQRVWRGERPQAGRFREFTQCDIDVIGIDSLALTFDAEPGRRRDASAGRNRGEGRRTLHLNNRKILHRLFAWPRLYRDPDQSHSLDRQDRERLKLKSSGIEAGLAVGSLPPAIADHRQPREETESNRRRPSRISSD